MATQHDRKVLASFPFLENQGRWSGAAEVIHRTSTFEDSGSTREFIDLSLRVGDRSVNVPIRGLEEVLEALKKAQPMAEEKLQEMLASQPRPDRNRDHNRGGGSGDRGRGSRDRGHRNRED